MLKTMTFLPTHLYLTLNLKVMPLECGDEICRKTRIMGLPYSEEIMIVGRTSGVTRVSGVRGQKQWNAPPPLASGFLSSLWRSESHSRTKIANYWKLTAHPWTSSRGLSMHIGVDLWKYWGLSTFRAPKSRWSRGCVSEQGGCPSRAYKGIWGELYRFRWGQTVLLFCNAVKRILAHKMWIVGARG